MLTDAQIDRWSRQILLPEVGGRGQARLLAGRVRVTGDGPAAAVAIDLLRRAGVAVVSSTTPPADLVVDVGGTTRDAAAPVVRVRLGGAAAVVTTLVGRPCAACAPDDAPAASDDALLAAPAARAAGALAAGEALVALLVPRPAGRRHVVDLAAGRFAAEPVAATPGCARCGTPR